MFFWRYAFSTHGVESPRLERVRCQRSEHWSSERCTKNLCSSFEDAVILVVRYAPRSLCVPWAVLNVSESGQVWLAVCMYGLSSVLCYLPVHRGQKRSGQRQQAVVFIPWVPGSHTHTNPLNTFYYIFNYLSLWIFYFVRFAALYGKQLQK